MKKAILITVAAFTLATTAAFSETIVDKIHHAFATCSGTGVCNACKNCKYCKNCSENGGSCGVCR